METIDREIDIDQQNTLRNGADIVRQGEAYPFAFDLNGSGRSGFTTTASVMQYPGKTPTITPTVTYTDGRYKGTITSAQTAALAVGEWYIYLEASDADEDIRRPLKFYVVKGWT